MEKVISDIKKSKKRNVDKIKNYFQVLFGMCSNEDIGKDAFRDAGGLEFLFDFLCQSESTVVRECALKLLALVMDENVHNQSYLTKRKVFQVIKNILVEYGIQESVLKVSAIFISVLLFRNGSAQILMAEEGCIDCLIHLYKKCALFSTMTGYTKSSAVEYDVTTWLYVNSALCSAVNNPINENNQLLCSSLFSLCLSMLESSSDSEISNAVSCFLMLCISNNLQNQNKFTQLGGPLIVKKCLQNYIDLINIDSKVYPEDISKMTVGGINGIVGIISAAVFDNERNAKLFGKLSVLSTMIELLSSQLLDGALRTKIFLALGHSIDAYVGNQRVILEVENFEFMLKKDLGGEDPELKSAAQYLLTICLMTNDANKTKHQHLKKGRSEKYVGSTSIGFCENPGKIVDKKVEWKNDEDSSSSTSTSSSIVKSFKAKSLGTQMEELKFPCKRKNLQLHSVSDLKYQSYQSAKRFNCCEDKETEIAFSERDKVLELDEKYVILKAVKTSNSVLDENLQSASHLHFLMHEKNWSTSESNSSDDSSDEVDELKDDAHSGSKEHSNSIKSISSVVSCKDNPLYMHKNGLSSDSNQNLSNRAGSTPKSIHELPFNKCEEISLSLIKNNLHLSQCQHLTSIRMNDAEIQKMKIRDINMKDDTNVSHLKKGDKRNCLDSNAGSNDIKIGNPIKCTLEKNISKEKSICEKPVCNDKVRQSTFDQSNNLGVLRCGDHKLASSDQRLVEENISYINPFSDNASNNECRNMPNFEKQIRSENLKQSKKIRKKEGAQHIKGNLTNCVEVISFDGPVCAAHKLATGLEMLQVFCIDPEN